MPMGTSKRRRWSDLDDKAIRENNGYGDNQMLADRLRCSESQIRWRRQQLKQKAEKPSSSKDIIIVPAIPTITANTRSITSRPAFFETEDLDKLMRARRV